jgi:hypothetical protein
MVLAPGPGHRAAAESRQCKATIPSRRISDTNQDSPTLSLQCTVAELLRRAFDTTPNASRITDAHFLTLESATTVSFSSRPTSRLPTFS